MLPTLELYIAYMRKIKKKRSVKINTYNQILNSNNIAQWGGYTVTWLHR